MLYVISQSLCLEDPFGYEKDTPMAYLSAIDRNGFTFSSLENAILFTNCFAFQLADYYNYNFRDELQNPVNAERLPV